jgi:hypothetical protein
LAADAPEIRPGFSIAGQINATNQQSTLANIEIVAGKGTQVAG